MPYIHWRRRTPLDAVLASLNPMTPGELNYALTRVCVGYLGRLGSDTYSYADMAEVVGALECAKLEFVRRMLAPYEDKKRAENGEVYACPPE